MQKIAAYLLERREGMDSPQARAEEAIRLRATISEWLHSKGAKETTPSGTYNAEDGSHATFTIEEAVDGDRSWWMLRLEELTDQGRRFVTAVSVTNGGEIVAVYATMEVGSDSTSIDRVRADPRCPKVVRALLRGCRKISVMKVIANPTGKQPWDWPYYDAYGIACSSGSLPTGNTLMGSGPTRSLRGGKQASG